MSGQRSFLSLIGNPMTICLFAFFCGASWVWVYFHLPETKGQYIEQIRSLWTEAKT